MKSIPRSFHIGLTMVVFFTLSMTARAQNTAEYSQCGV